MRKYLSSKIMNDQGSIMTLGIGLAVATLMCVTVSVNVAALWVAKQSLNSIADSAALAAATGIDTSQIYTQGFNSRIPLSESQARKKVLTFFTKSQIAGDLSQFKLLSVRVVDDEVSVTIQATAQLPFGYLIFNQSPKVVSQAHAINILSE
jgi:uncharacterized membrane protein